MDFKKNNNKDTLLRCYSIDSETFDEILEKYSSYCEICDLSNYLKGYKEKSIIRVDPSLNTLIMREFLVPGLDKIDDINFWRQCRLTRVNARKGLIEPSREVSGSYAYNFIMKILRKYYTDAEIDFCLRSHQEEKGNMFNQVHYMIFSKLETNRVYRVDNCIEYDINSAHGDAIREIFPKAAREIEELYIHRKDNPINKKYMNYFVGELGNESKNNGKYRNTYWWIVHRTTKMLLEMMGQVGGVPIYVNTDGFIVANPDQIVEGSKELGKFKIEYSGPVYLAKSDNYFLMQYEDTMKGNVPISVRDHIDLRTGKIITYDIEPKHVDGIGYLRLINNLQELQVGVEKYEI